MILAAILFAVYWVISRAGAVKKDLKWNKTRIEMLKKKVAFSNLYSELVMFWFRGKNFSNFSFIFLNPNYFFQLLF